MSGPTPQAQPYPQGQVPGTQPPPSPPLPPGTVPATVLYPPGTVPPQVVYYQQQVPAAAPPAAVEQLTHGSRAQHEAELEREAKEVPQLRIYTHSPIYYWWPVWVAGYLMAILTWWHGEVHGVGGDAVKFFPNSSLGVIFFLTLFVVFLITNISVRGTAGGTVILAAVLGVVLLAYFNMWDTVLHWFGDLRIHLDLGAYFWFSTLMFLVWLSTVFLFDRLSYWLIKPGQITLERVIGAGSRSYDTNGMVLEKYQGDLFRHWVLGLGAGDMHIMTTGATRDRLDLPNVLFIGSKIAAIQRMIAERPNEFGNASLK